MIKSEKHTSLLCYSRKTFYSGGAWNNKANISKFIYCLYIEGEPMKSVYSQNKFHSNCIHFIFKHMAKASFTLAIFCENMRF